jgi:NADPH:quinone reductase-like Zn-dependent oxidoreductase
MEHAFRFSKTGGPEVLTWEKVTVADPGPGEARIRHVAVGLNMADTYFRTGLYPVPLPNGIGMEGSGVVEAVGPGVTSVAVGDRVAYTGSPLGAYATARVLPAGVLVKLPESISFQTGAAMMMRGLSAAYLIRKIHPLKAGDTVLFHAAAGGVGLIFSQWAKLLGINVIGTVSSEAKAKVAKAHGCTHVLNYADFPRHVREITNGAGVPVVFDGVGKDTFMQSIDCLKRRGLLVLMGTSSGPVPPIDPMLLVTKGSLYMTRPALADFLADPAERAELVGELFGHVGSGCIKIEINQHYPLENAVQAHRDLEARKTTGSSIFVV